ncbi:peptidylprolyl isomerase [Anabaena sp. FACHB-1237]|uniref:peptidylprolyl isomerase n=1 Tax=Anabaena sp. FACHB-1237 TaxID=2692769 RepID=UPI00167FFE4E|nr:peptidylprolyl isomerase [Anabaena sp. FACHB-1237]MBD2139563.1 peptidylprolyl isomerase [Anabaena sp. FACHB-1237]
MSTNTVLQLGDRILSPTEVLQLLAQYNLVPLLQKEIIIDQAIESIEYTAEEEKIACEQIAQQYQAMGQQAMSSQELKNIAIKQLKIEKFKQKQWGEDISNYFFERKPLLDKIMYSLISTNSIGIAQEIYFRIQEGEQSFGELARKYSQGPEAQTDGLVGPVDLQSIHPRLRAELSRSQPQKLLPPITINNNIIVIVRLEKLIPAQLDSQMRQRLLNEKFNYWFQEQVNKQEWQIGSS